MMLDADLHDGEKMTVRVAIIEEGGLYVRVEDVYRELCAAEYRGELIRTHKDGKTYWVRKYDRRGY